MKNLKVNLKNKNLNHTTQKLLVVALGVFVAVFASYVQAMSRPSSTSTNAPTVLNTGSDTMVVNSVAQGPQNKIGFMGVRAFTAGDYATSGATNVAMFDAVGAMALGKSTTPSSGGIVLDIGGTTGIKGTIRSEDLKNSGNRELCADPNGKVVLCTVQEFFAADIYSGYYGFMTPEGVSTMTVEVYGGGGSGYGKTNFQTGADNGQSSFLIGEDASGQNVSIIAYGGKGADKTTVGGVGGTVSVTNASIVAQQTGGDGTAPGSFTGSSIQIGTSNTCTGVTYKTIAGANGNVGGNGGKPYNGSNANGGSYGGGAPTSGTNGGGWDFNLPPGGFTNNATDCNYVGLTSDDLVQGQYKNYRPGGDGANGASYGAGGAGFGGKGGLSGVFDNSGCPNDQCEGGVSVAGGGAGGYVKATFSTSFGKTYYIKAGYKGVFDFYSCNTNSFSSGCLDDIGGGAIPGNGADGYVKITYN